MALPYFQENGWEPLILAVDHDRQTGIRDPTLCLSIPEGLHTRLAGAIPIEFTEWCGIRTVALRSHFYLRLVGSRMIRGLDPKVVFFSTTMFPVMTLGRYWRRVHGVPYVLDFQDPWVSDDAVTRIDQSDRGRKYHLDQWIARRLEPFALRGASHVISVSPAYPRHLCSRYPWLGPDKFTVLPFGAPKRDFELLDQLAIRQTAFSPNDGRRHWVYVGCVGDAMALTVRALFKALRLQVDAQPSLRSELHLHFIGTDYAPPERARKTVEPLAVEAGVADMVTEQTGRVPYFEALQCLVDADALIVLGSADPGYTASKLFPYVLARKPLLAVFHVESSVVEVLTRTGAGTVVPFTSLDTSDAIALRITASGWLKEPRMPETDWTEFDPFTAREMTRRLCEVFDQCAAD